jgi:hypothetical protein
MYRLSPQDIAEIESQAGPPEGDPQEQGFLADMLGMASAVTPDWIEDPALTGLRYADRVARLAGLGIGTVASFALDPMRSIPGPVGDWVPDVMQTPDAFRAFMEQVDKGDWDAAIGAYQDEFDAGPGFWGTSEVLGAFIPTGVPALAGSKLISTAPRLAGTLARVAPSAVRPVERGIRGVGKGLRAPWEFEEFIGRQAVRGGRAALGMRGAPPGAAQIIGEPIPGLRYDPMATLFAPPQGAAPEFEDMDAIRSALDEFDRLSAEQDAELLTRQTAQQGGQLGFGIGEPGQQGLLGTTVGDPGAVSSLIDADAIKLQQARQAEIAAGQAEMPITAAAPSPTAPDVRHPPLGILPDVTYGELLLIRQAVDEGVETVSREGAVAPPSLTREDIERTGAMFDAYGGMVGDVPPFGREVDEFGRPVGAQEIDDLYLSRRGVDDLRSDVMREVEVGAEWEGYQERLYELEKRGVKLTPQNEALIAREVVEANIAWWRLKGRLAQTRGTAGRANKLIYDLVAERHGGRSLADFNDILGDDVGMMDRLGMRLRNADIQNIENEARQVLFGTPTTAAPVTPGAAVAAGKVSLTRTYDAFSETRPPRDTYIDQRGEERSYYPQTAYTSEYMVKSDDTNRLLRWVYELSDGRKVSIEGYLKAAHPELKRKIVSGKNALRSVWRELTEEEREALVDSIPWDEAVPRSVTYGDTYKDSADRSLEEWLKRNKHPLADVGGQAETHLNYRLQRHLRSTPSIPTPVAVVPSEITPAVTATVTAPETIIPAGTASRTVSDIDPHTISVNRANQPREDVDPDWLYDEANVSRIVDEFDPNLMEALWVREVTPNAYELIHGHNRLEAAKRVGARIDIKVLDVTAEQAAKLGGEANLLGWSLNVPEIAGVLTKQLAEGKSPAEIIKNLPAIHAGGKIKANQIQAYADIVLLPDVVKNALRTGIYGDRFNRDHAIAMAQAMRKHDLPTDQLQAFFNEIFTTQDLTPAQVTKILDQFGPLAKRKVAEGVQGGFPMEGLATEYEGLMGQIREAYRIVEEANRVARKATQLANTIEKGGDAVTPGVREALEAQKELAGRLKQQAEDAIARVKGYVLGGESVTGPVPTTVVTAPDPVTGLTEEQLKFPARLGTSKPNYKQHPLRFESDVDNALYIVTKAKRTPRDAKFLSWLVDDLGLDSTEVLDEGRKLRRAIAETDAKMDDAYAVIQVPPSKYSKPEAIVPTPVTTPVTTPTTPTGAPVAPIAGIPTGVPPADTVTGVGGFQPEDTVPLTSTEWAEASMSGGTSGKPPSRTTTGGQPPGGKQPPGTPPLADGPLGQLQDMDEAINIATRGSMGRKIAQIRGISKLWKRLNPAALANIPEAKALLGRALLRFEGQQKTEHAMATLNRLGSVERIFGKTDDQGLLTEGELAGQALNDVRTRPHRYRLTDAQKRWIEAADDIERSKAAFLESNGVDIKKLGFTDGGQYAGRRIYGRYDSKGELTEVGEVKSDRVGKNLAANKSRGFATAKEAIEAGFRYLPEEEVLRLNVQQAYYHVAEKRFFEWMVKNSRSLRVVTKGNPQKVLIEHGIDDVAPRFSKHVFTGPDAVELANMMKRELAPGLNRVGATATNIQKINAVTRFMTLNGDASPFLIQLLFMAGQSPKAWGMSIKGYVKAFGDPLYHSNLIANNRDLLNRHRGIITSLQGSEMTEATQKGGLLFWGPLMPIRKALDPFGRAFNAAMDTAAISLAQSFENTMPGLANDVTKLADIDDYINEIRGLAAPARIGVSANQRAWENILLLAPRYTRAIAALLWDAGQGMVGAGGVRGQQARNALIKSIAGLSAIGVGFSIAEYVRDTPRENQTYAGMMNNIFEHLNPSSPRFFTWNVAGTNIGPGTKVRSLIALVARSAEDPSKLWDLSMENPVTRFTRGNLAPVPADAWDVWQGYNFKGESTGIFNTWRDDEGFLDRVKDLGVKVILPDIMPIWTQAALLEGGSFIDRVLLGGTEFVGGRSSPISRSQVAEDIAIEQGLIGGPDQPKTFEDLPAGVKDQIDQMVDMEHGKRPYTGQKGQHYKSKDDANQEFLDTLYDIANTEGHMDDRKDMGYLTSDPSGEYYDPKTARAVYNRARHNTHIKLFGGWSKENRRYEGGIYDDLYDMDKEFEEPDLNTPAHDVWRYYRIFDQIMDENGKPDFELLDQLEAEFWISLDTEERANFVLDSIRVKENNYPPSVRNMVDAMRYAGKVKINLGGAEPVSYFDLENHPEVIARIIDLSGRRRNDVEYFLGLNRNQQEARARDEGVFRDIKHALDVVSGSNGILTYAKEAFIRSAPDEWIWAMFDSGYDYKMSDQINASLRHQMKRGLRKPLVDYRGLYRETLISAR